MSLLLLFHLRYYRNVTRATEHTVLKSIIVLNSDGLCRLTLRAKYRPFMPLLFTSMIDGLA